MHDRHIEGLQVLFDPDVAGVAAGIVFQRIGQDVRVDVLRRFQELPVIGLLAVQGGLAELFRGGVSEVLHRAFRSDGDFRVIRSFFLKGARHGTAAGVLDGEPGRRFFREIDFVLAERRAAVSGDVLAPEAGRIVFGLVGNLLGGDEILPCTVNTRPLPLRLCCGCREEEGEAEQGR